MTDTDGNLVEHDSYDAWGKHRQLNGADDANNTITSKTTRGFTDQEQIQDTTLINMNARVYDPLIARFLSPDPMIQDVYNPQDLNAYSYVDNNPLSITDPTGMCKGIFGCIVSFLPEIASVVVAIYAPELLGVLEAAEGFGTSAGLSIANAVIAGAASGAISSGGNLDDIGIDAATAGALYEVGSLTGGHFYNGGAGFGLTNGNETLAAWAESPQFEENIVGHGLIGGLASIAQGGSFQAGFLAAGFSDGAGVGADILNPGFTVGLAAAATSGGVASVIGGGKFSNGVETGAFGYLFNSCGGPHGCFDAGVATGTAAGIAGSIGCDVGTGGACVILDPIIVGSTAVVGGLVGGVEDAWGDLSSGFGTIFNASAPAPNGLPSGTRPIDRWGIPRDDIHDIKIGAYGDPNPTGYVGITPGGQVIITGPNGEAEDAGHVDDYTNKPLPQFPRPGD